MTATPDPSFIASVALALVNGDADLEVTIATGANWAATSGDSFATITLSDQGGANLGL